MNKANVLAQDTDAKSFTSFIKQGPFEFTPELIYDLQNVAEQESLQRARVCLHEKNSNFQQMLIAMTPGSFIPPHKQQKRRKSYIMIQGRLKLFFFNEDGSVGKIIELASLGQEIRQEALHGCWGYHFTADTYHTPVAQSDCCIYLETIEGSYAPQETLFAPWAPGRDDIEGLSRYFAQLT